MEFPKLRKNPFDFYVLISYSIMIVYVTLILSKESKVKITWDGLLYIISAKALFSENMGEMYHWIREPGYPLFLKIFLGQPDDFNNVVLAQSLVFAISSILCFAYFYQNSQSNYLKFLVFLAGIFSYYICYGYSTWILQQTLFIFLTSLHLMYMWLIDVTNLDKKSFILISSCLLLFTGVVSVLLLPASFVVITFCMRMRQAHSEDMSRKNIWMLGLIVLPLLIFLLTWNAYKFSEISKSQQIYADYESVTDYGKADIRSLIFLAPASVGGILGYGPARGPGGADGLPAEQHFFYAFNYSLGGLGCPYLTHGPDGVVPLLQKDLDNIGKECTNGKNILIFNQIAHKVEPFLPLITFFSFLGLIFFNRRTHKTFTMPFIFPIISAIPYLFEEYGTPRYGLPFIFLSPFLLAYILFQLCVKTTASLRKI
jgi:hypothetical protein